MNELRRKIMMASQGDDWYLWQWLSGEDPLVNNRWVDRVNNQIYPNRNVTHLPNENCYQFQDRQYFDAGGFRPNIIQDTKVIATFNAEQLKCLIDFGSVGGVANNTYSWVFGCLNSNNIDLHTNSKFGGNNVGSLYSAICPVEDACDLGVITTLEQGTVTIDNEIYSYIKKKDGSIVYGPNGIPSGGKYPPTSYSYRIGCASSVSSNGQFLGKIYDIKIYRKKGMNYE